VSEISGSPYTFLSNGTAKAAAVKASAGTLLGLSLGNTNAAACYVRLYNKATAPLTSDTPVLRYVVPGATAGAGREVQLPPGGLSFTTGIGIRITTLAADSDDTAAASNEVTVSAYYR
jgi:hypothetical protein